MKKILIALVLLIIITGNALAEKVYNTDLVIVGSGVAGLTAAAFASEQGIKTILIEKLPQIGGQLIIIEGTFAVGTKIQKRDMVGLTKFEAFRQIMNYATWKADAGYNKKLVDTADKTIAWLQEKGVEMGPVITDTPDGNRVYHTYQSGFPGKPYIDAMMNVIKKSDTLVLTETPGKSLIVDKNNTVTGIMAENEDGEAIRINAKAVLLATGSFADNREMLQKYNPSLPKDIKHISPLKNKGDGIIMGQAVGADVANMNVMIFEGAVPINTEYQELHYSEMMLDAYMILRTSSLWLNKNGERFFNEALSGDYTVVSNALAANGNTQILIMDDDTRMDLIQGGGSHANYFTLYERGQLITKFDDVVKDGMKRGYAFKANSIEELAKMMRMEPKVIRASVDRYNELAMKGEDLDMGKDINTMKPIVKGPFYGFIGVNTICDVAGGLKINKNAQVVHVNGQPIKGLYAAGATSGGMYGANYPYIMPGYASSAAMNSGRFAVEHFAETVLKKKIR
jgi:fumarate reductase flavoprotein subunit